MTAIYVAGMGCRRGCDHANLQSLLASVLEEAQLSVMCLSALATLETKKDEAGMTLLAQYLTLPIYYFSAEQLATYHERLQQPSQKVWEATGSAGIAEASALALAESMSGGQARLIIPKRSNAVATIAIAGVDAQDSRFLESRL